MHKNTEKGNESPSPAAKKRKGLKLSLGIKVTALIAVSIALVAAVSNLFIFQKSFDAFKEEIRNNLIRLAANTTVSIDGDKLATIQTPDDEGSQTYLELQKKLQEIKDASDGKLKYVYSIAKKDDGTYMYVLDAEPIDSEDHSAVGDEFPMGDYPEAINGFEMATADQQALVDEEFGGMVQSGYAPIRDGSGNVVGMLGIDMDVTVIREKEAVLLTARELALGVAVLLALVLGIAFSKYLTKPILVLKKGTRSIAEGDFNTIVTVKRNDELGELAGAFNSMTADLKVSHEALKQYSLELEDKVAQRTAQLSEINKEIKDILDNMSQAIFTINGDLRFNEQHSMYAYDIFGKTEFSEKSILDLFCAGDDQAKARESLASWLELIFKNEMEWSNLEPLQPVREVKIIKRNESGNDETRYINFEFQPITDLSGKDLKEKVTKVMVIVQDITDKKALEIEMQQKEQQYKDNINQIVEIIKMDQELFQDFINECKENLVNFEPKLIALKDDKGNTDLINDLFRIMHTIKGNSRMFKLERIAGEAHSIENIFSSIRKGERAMTDELLDETFRKLDKFNAMFNEMLDIYEKIASGKSADLGKTRSEERQKEDTEVIKVKLNEINRLTELIKKADRLVSNDFAGAISDKVCSEKVQAIENVFRETQKQLDEIRKISLARLFARIPRMVRDISMELGKKVKLTTKGEEISIDKNIFDKLGDPLIHILRNSVDHGIETPEERKSLGKPEEGLIELNTTLSESELLVEIRDDGKGLDIDRIKAKAVKNGLITPEKAMGMSDGEAADLIFMPGFSTNDKVTSVSGRGVGMDVVKTSIEEALKGDVIVESHKNEGLRITLKIPLAC